MIPVRLACAVLGVLLFTTSHAQQVPADFYVATTGQDSNPGTSAAPFATLTQAQKAVRATIAGGLTKDILVTIHGGVYAQTTPLTFGPEDSGTADHSVTYAAAPGEQVVLSGGRRIGGWHIGAVNIWTTTIPEVKAGQWYFRQLFINGARATRARTPNADATPAWWKTTSSSASKDHPPADAPVTMKVSGPVAAWNNPDDVELIYMQNNESARKRLGTIDAQAQSFTLSLPNRTNPKVFSYDWQLSLPIAGKPCYFENALEFLDQPGEWYLDRHTGVLSYWPRPGEDLSQAEVIAPVAQNTLLAVAGTPDHPVTNLHFDGLQVQYVDWPLPPWGYMALFCCNVAYNVDSPKPGHGSIEGAVEFKDAHDCSFNDGAITDAGGNGLVLRGGTSRIDIVGNEIGQLGGGGITLGWPNVSAGYTGAAPAPKPGEYSGYRIANNLIHHCGEDYFGAVGILAMGISHSAISHNLIHDTAYIGLGIAGTQDPKVAFGGDNTIEYNHIYNAMLTTIDGAGIYITFAQNGGGTLLRGNVIHDTFGNPYHDHDGTPWHDHPPCAGIYLDGNCTHATFEENLVYHNTAAGPLIFDYPGAREKNNWSDNLFFKDVVPQPELVEGAQRFAGLEPEYAAKLTPTAKPPSVRYELGDSSSQARWSATQYDFPEEKCGIIQVVVRDTNLGRPIELKPHGDGLFHYAQFYGDTETPQATWGPEPMPMLGPIQPLPLTTMFGLISDRKMDGTISLHPNKSPRVLWLFYSGQPREVHQQ